MTIREFAKLNNFPIKGKLTLYSFPILIAPSFFLRIHSHTVMI